MLTCFGMIWNCDNFSRQNKKIRQNVDNLKELYLYKIDSKNILVQL
jgi:hypothetical protein